MMAGPVKKEEAVTPKRFFRQGAIESLAWLGEHGSLSTLPPLGLNMVVDKVSWFHDIFQAPLPNIRRMIEGRVPTPLSPGIFNLLPSSESSGLVSLPVHIQKAMSFGAMESVHQMRSL
jgi:hypothetical protein